MSSSRTRGGLGGTAGRLAVVAGLCALTLYITACQTWMETVYKGRPPNEPVRLAGDGRVRVRVVEWVHPYVFEGTFVVDGKAQSEWFILVEECKGYREHDDGSVEVPGWVFLPDRGYSTLLQRKAAAARLPPGTEVRVSFPLKGKVVRNRPYPNSPGDVLVYQGYLVRIE